MYWCCFLFCCGYRLTLALLAHFNWFASIYVNCVYFVLWKSYDLLWFWMHLILCICFKPLRTKNYLIVWCNLIRKQNAFYPNSTYKEVYMIEYGKSQKLKKQGLDKSNETKVSDYEQEERDSDSDDQAVDVMEIFRSPQVSNVKSAATLGSGEEECTCLKQISLTVTESSASTLRQGDHNACGDIPLPPPRLKKQVAKLREEQKQEIDSHTPIRRNQFDIRVMIPKSLKNFKQYGYCTSCGKKERTLDDAVEMETDGTDGMDVLTPDFTNKRDLISAGGILLRQKLDRRRLRKRLQAQKRAELEIIAKYEAKQKTISMAVELLLQILQMMASFAILVGNIRRTFIPAHFTWLKDGHNDSMDLMLLWRCTVFLDVLLFWISVIWTYCMQWHLCCRLGLMRFWVWLLILGTIGLFVLYPMFYIQNNLDITWCQFKPNSTLAQYQPSW